MNETLLHPSSDLNLLFGIIARQLNFISDQQLVAGVEAWRRDKSRQLDQILVDQSALREADRDLLAPLVARHLEDHGGDPQQVIAGLSSLGSVVESLKSLGDTGVNATLSMLVSNPLNAASDVTIVHDSQSATATNQSAREASEARFRIVRSHAKGGLGEVYLAQDTELNRDVALKEIQAKYADDATSRSRFLLEAEVTGSLEHPGIVPVYGLGHYTDGRPFYAMRFIRGDSLQEAADRFHGRSDHRAASERTSQATGSQRRGLDFQGLLFRKLLGRFIDVCQAIEYAHSRGVLHRDLKPGNIMLGKYGETLVVDWGLAKAQERDESVASDQASVLRPASASGSRTMLGSAVGTPAFMPPEQAAGKLDQLGPPSDVYSLGATLYYLLTGHAPFRGKQVSEILERVQAGQFPHPREACPDAPKALEAICLRAMATNSTDRYASPQQLADDVERYLADEPVTAYREPFGLRTRRWIRKHPRTVAALAATLLVGLASASIIAVLVQGKNAELAAKNRQLSIAYAAESEARSEATAQRNRAWQSERIAKANQAEAQRREKETATVLQFFADRVLAAARPKNLEGGLGIDATIRAAMDAAEPTISDAFRDQPLVEAHIRGVLGRTYYTLGAPDPAIAQLERARDIQFAQLGASHPVSLVTLNDLALTYQQAGRLAEVAKLMEENLKQTRDTFGPEHVETLTLMNNLANAYQAAGRYREAVSLLKKTLQLKTAAFGSEHAKTNRCRNDLALVHMSVGNLSEAEKLLDDVLKVNQASLGPEHPDTITTMANLAAIRMRTRGASASIVLLDKAYRLQKENRGADHPHTLNAMNNLAYAHFALGNMDDALLWFEKGLALHESAFGENHPTTLLYHNNLCVTYLRAGKHQQALLLLEKTVERSKAELGLEHPNTLISMATLAACHWNLAQFGRSVPLYEEVAHRMAKILGQDHPETLQTRINLGVNYRDAGELEKSISSLQEVLNRVRTRQGIDPSLLIWATGELGLTYFQAGQDEEAIRQYESRLAAARAFAQQNPTNADARRLWLRTATENGSSYQKHHYWIRAFEELEATREQLGQLGELGVPPESLQRDLDNLNGRCAEAAYTLGANLLVSEDQQAFEQHCQDCMRRFQDRPSTRSDYLVGRLLSLSNTSPEIAQGAIEFVTRANASDLPWHLHALGLARLRAGQFEDAKQRLNESLAKDWNAHVVNWLALAIAHYQLGESEPAREWIQQATDWLDKHPLDQTSELHVHDRIACKLLWREAQDLIQSGKIPRDGDCNMID